MRRNPTPHQFLRLSYERGLQYPVDQHSLNGVAVIRLFYASVAALLLSMTIEHALAFTVL
ncbi:hypothetical protein CR51_17775 [Caballeronia megalochromosomata]|jgi:hypothetical protein|nr:hypothetical protein CR51_17775 [Caballeronia megalochromosomata]